ncbi:hypothetical protein LTS07_005376 [Exophiala sideris]|uniref:Uncharacterized protein n=1 Tax=Exophiala sideris TaxID=1016849 RepID=A0ABR0JB46_9EURO|nr:hypothetical protein LTS07_005376 [Exophiala sideris]KAK5038646.1 hypothetical protein LTR13_004393 [Exophiala sideris]KAK5060527.1 hypothetical protein LTR69_005844 [Exophiala sideris]KAK5183439.1 hypothetical protein LTR44_004440 [Eurotiomycetes sp. CCFEE 6388]
MVFTRSRANKAIAAEVADIEQACANNAVATTDPDYDTTMDYDVGTANTSNIISSTSIQPNVAQVNVVSTKVNVSDQQVTVTTTIASGTATNLAQPVQSTPSSAPASEVKAKGRGKRKLVDTASDATITKKLRVSKTKTIKLKKEEDDDDFHLSVIPTTADNAPPRRESLRKRGSNATTSTLLDVATAAEEDNGASFLTLKLCPGYLDKISANPAAIPAANPVANTITNVSINKIKKTKKRVIRPRRKTPYTNNYRFEFGEDRLQHHVSPTPDQLAEVISIMGQERLTLANLGQVQPASSVPMHAGNGISADSIVRVIVSQSCINEMALDAQATMRLAYPYVVNGTMVVGTKPNYHAMRVQSVDKLKKVLKKAGLQNLKAPAIKGCLDMIYAKNVALLQPGEVIYDGNDPTASDFVPGLLSLDYLWNLHRQGGKQAVFDELVLLPQIAVKSACCVMAFNMDLPVFAVDTHVAGMAKLLG